MCRHDLPFSSLRSPVSMGCCKSIRIRDLSLRLRPDLDRVGHCGTSSGTLKGQAVLRCTPRDKTRPRGWGLQKPPCSGSLALRRVDSTYAPHPPKVTLISRHATWCFLSPVRATTRTRVVSASELQTDIGQDSGAKIQTGAQGHRVLFGENGEIAGVRARCGGNLDFHLGAVLGDLERVIAISGSPPCSRRRRYETGAQVAGWR